MVAEAELLEYGTHNLDSNRLGGLVVRYQWGLGDPGSILGLARFRVATGYGSCVLRWLDSLNMDWRTWQPDRRRQRGQKPE